MSLLSLPVELRLKIYAMILVYRSSSVNWVFHFNTAVAPTTPPDLALLRVCRTIRSEASMVFYSKNSFMFGDRRLAYTESEGGDKTVTTVPAIADFIQQIGPVNAAHLRHIRITFPTAWEYDGAASKVTLHEEYLKILRLIRDSCPALGRLEFKSWDVFDLDNPAEAIAVLRAMDAEAPRLMPSLREIKVLSPFPRQPEHPDAFAAVQSIMPDPRWAVGLFHGQVGGWMSTLFYRVIPSTFPTYRAKCRFEEEDYKNRVGARNGPALEEGACEPTKVTRSLEFN